ncbi:MAG: hypothetical protein QMC81_01755 [Thermoanaerobacterales bacterium]|nr:hypothetical protein [Thermoanaerobacterales bacterium]
MRTIHFDLGPEVEARDFVRLARALPLVEPEDRLEITMEAADVHQAGRVFTMLRENGFDFQPKGSHEGLLYKVSAWRRAVH